MSEENVEIVARLVDAWNQANVEAMLALFDPECEVIFPPEVPEPGPFHGPTELREWAEGFLAAWESHHAEVVELIEADHSIVAILHLIGRGSGSGIEMDETDAHVFTFSDGKVTRWRNFSDRSEALEAAGLSEKPMSQENVEIVRRAIDANRSGPPEDTVEKAVALTDPNIEFLSRLTSVEGATYRGHDGVRAYFKDMADAWQEWRNEVDEMTEVGPDAVLTSVTVRATGKSGVDVELRSAVVCVLSGGRILEIHSYPSRQEALETAGLSE